MTQRRKKQSRGNFEYQNLEVRQLLAGDVTVSLQGELLQITGDGSANEIRVFRAANGNPQVAAIPGTTINGRTTPFEVNSPVRNLRIQMAGGDDKLELEGVITEGILNIDLGDGNDSLKIRDISIRNLNVGGQQGNDVMQFHNTYSVGNISLQSHAGDDTLSITALATERGLQIVTGDGADTVGIDNLGVRENLILATGAANDRVFVTGEVYTHKAVFDLFEGDDLLAAIPQTSGESTNAVFRRRLNVQAGDGNDTLFFGPSVISQKNSLIDGGAGSDAVGSSTASLRRAQYAQVESRELNNVNAALETFYSNFRSLGIDTTPFGQSVRSSVLDLQDTGLAVPANSGPLAVDNALTLTGASTTTVSGATVRIQSHISNEDVLAFANTGNISGTFNAATGVLTLTGTATLAEYQAALRTITYDNTRALSLAGTRQVNFEVTTSTNTVTGSRTLNLQGVEAPVLSVNNDSLTIPQTSPAVAVDDQLTLAGDSQIRVSGATVAVVNFSAGQDVLAYTNANGITGNFDASTGVLTLSGNATLAQYQSALRTVTYDTSAAQFTAKTISFSVSTNAGNVTDTRDLVPAAVLTTTSSPLKHFGVTTATSLDNRLELRAQPGTTISQVRVAITEGYVSGQDILTFANTTKILGNFDAASGVLTLTGDASAAEYQAALRSISFDNTQTTTLEQTRKVNIVVSTNRGDFTAIREIDLGDQLAIRAYAVDNGLTTQVTSTGLHYIVDRAGNGTFPTSSDSVRVNYVGRLTNGTRFDSNNNVTFRLNQVIRGWTEGIPLFSVGGKGRLLIPSSLAYGPTGQGSIPPNSVLIFDIDLLGIET